MKKLSVWGLKILPILISAALLPVSCGNDGFEDPVIGEASVEIELLESENPMDCCIRLIPDDNSAGFRCAIGTDGDLDRFVNGEITDMDRIREFEGNEAVEVVFSGLPQGYYEIYAQSYDSNGTAGGVSIRKVFLSENEFKVSQYYLTDRTAGFKMEFTPSFYRFEYYLGTASDREKFLNGELDTKAVEDVSIYRIINFMDLEPGRDYVFYAVAYDMRDVKSELVEIPFSTYSDLSQMPSVAFQIRNMDVYMSTVEVIPNDKCSMVHTLRCYYGEHDGFINNDMHFKGDYPLMINNWIGDPSVNISSGETISVKTVTPEITCDNSNEIYAVTYDKEGNLSGLYHFVFTTPSFNGKAEEGEISITVSDITAHGATYTYEFDEKLFGFMYETVEADWYDEFRQTSEWSENYLHDLIYSSWQNNSRFIYAKGNEQGRYAVMENEGLPLTRYYATACPVNENGASGGWMPVVMESYTTLAE